MMQTAAQCQSDTKVAQALVAVALTTMKPVSHIVAMVDLAKTYPGTNTIYLRSGTYPTPFARTDAVRKLRAFSEVDIIGLV